MFLSNIDKFINQYENTHGMDFKENVDVRVIMGGSGAALATTKHGIFAKSIMILNETRDAGDKLVVSPVNPYVDVIKAAMKKGIKFYLCQEASRTLKISNKNKIEGIHYVPAAHAATADLQLDGYAILIP
jgi:intracellular sulfur oxidation DsrE/DsrF family protein